MSKYRRIQSDEREIISQLVSRGMGATAIGEVLGRNKSSISWELKPFRIAGKKNSAFVAQHSADELSRKHHCRTKIESHLQWSSFIEQKLTLKWSPQQISMSLKEHYGDDPSMQLSDESIYTYIYRKHPVNHVPNCPGLFLLRLPSGQQLFDSVNRM